jgi:hypothetical protein
MFGCYKWGLTKTMGLDQLPVRWKAPSANVGPAVLRVRFFRVKPDKIERLRDWMEELHRRRDEVLETFAQESVRQEAAWLMETAEGTILVYAIEAEDLEQAQRAVEEKPLPIDLEHRAAMDEVIEVPIELEQLLDERA